MRVLREHHLPVTRTARFYTLGDPDAIARDVWFVCHGYGQLAPRFLRRFESLRAAHRLIVAPEALSRFYVEQPGRSHAQSPVGASWMTREDRLSEIDDYIRFLDAVYAQVFEWAPRAGAVVSVLGFSQGAAAAARWVARGAARADRLILWGGLLPHDLDLARDGARLREVELVTVSGNADAFLSGEAIAAQRERLAAYGILPRDVSYEGGHGLDDGVLAHLGAGGEECST